jgi:two-component system, NtrC family, sensor kinase
MGDEGLPKFGYHLDESDPDVTILRRQDGSFVAAFSAQGATREGLLEAAKEDYRRLVSRLRAGEERSSFLDVLPEHAVILRSSGTILTVNEAWKRFAEDNGADLGKVLEGANYLDVCDRATGEQSEYARYFAEGLRSVLLGKEERFAMEYPCHSPTERRWFVGSVGLLADGDLPLALVAHENVTSNRSVLEQ